METKTHWKKTFNKDYLGSHDLDEGQELKVIIKQVIVKDVKDPQGKSAKCNVAVFTDSTKPMILNVTACKQMKKFTGSNYIEDWKNIPIQIYVNNNVKAFGEITEALRIRDVQPTFKKPELLPGTKQWTAAIEFLKGDGSILRIKEKYKLSDLNETKIKDEVTI